MRRLTAIFASLGVTGAVAAILLSASAQGSSTSSFDVVFDNARGLIAGQLVKVAGAQAGSIQNVVVVRQGSGANTSFKAKVEGEIESQFMPFRANATCTIRPQGLIAENYVECDPGSPPAPVLQGAGGQPPTVPVQNTSEPVSLLDLFNIFNVPTRERFALIIDELGIGTAGEGQNFNDILNRANPALKLTNQVIGILAHQKAELATILDATSTIASQAASHTGNLQHFLDQAGTLSTTTANHRGSLALAINRLPGLLAAAQPSLQRLDEVASAGTPLVQEVHAAVPSLNRLGNDFPEFVSAAKPALADLGTTLKRAVPAIKQATPVVGLIKNYLHRSLASTIQIGKLFQSLQRHGFTENFLSIVYYGAALFARFDANSHIGVAYLQDPGTGFCETYATTPVPGCDRHYGSGPAFVGGRARAGTGSASNGRSGGAVTHATDPTASASPQTTPSAPAPPSNALQSLINFLLK